jgi:putative phosphoesterase
MRIALIGDVHANLPALLAVLEHAEQQAVSAIWNTGDFLGYGAFPNQVIDILRRHEVLSVIGNYDRKVLKFERKADKWRRKKRPEKFLAFKWAYENLSDENRFYLQSLSKQLRIKLGRYRALLVHGSPDSIKEHLLPDTPVARLRELGEASDTDLVICGHSHRPFVRKAGDVWFVNTGSVGRPEDGDPRATYALLEMRESHFQVHHFRVAYDVQRAVAAIRRQRLPEAFAQMVLQARDLDAVKPTQQIDATFSPFETALQEDSRLQLVRQLGEQHGYDERHAHQVMQLALKLFDDLRPLHQLGGHERRWLKCAALLHEIGLSQGQKGHHKAAYRLIRDAKELPFRRRERKIIGLIARYHRKAFPKKNHKGYKKLSSGQRRRVRILASLLRLADGLAAEQVHLVQILNCEFTFETITLLCAVTHQPDVDTNEAVKGELLEHVFRRVLQINWEIV